MKNMKHEMLHMQLQKKSNLNRDMKRKETLLSMMNKMKKLAQEEDQDPDLLSIAVSSSEENLPQWAKFWIDPHQNAKERLLNLENEMRNKNLANSRPTDKMEAFERKIYARQYKFNQKVAEHLKAALNTNNLTRAKEKLHYCTFR